MKAILVKGYNTYAIRYSLQKLGARWNKNLAGWVLPVSKLNDVRRIIGKDEVSITAANVPVDFFLKSKTKDVFADTKITDY